MEVTYSPLPATLTLDTALAAGACLGGRRRLERLQGGQEGVVGTLSGVVGGGGRCTTQVELGGQEHFYWEPHAALAVPGERGELTVHYTTQATPSPHHLSPLHLCWQLT